MDLDPSYFPLRGKKCVISKVSLSEAEVDDPLTPDEVPAFTFIFREKLAQNLKNIYGLEVLDHGVSREDPDIIISVKFTKITKGSWILNIVDISWIAPGIGFVKKIYQYGDDDQEVVQLVSFHKNKKE